MLRRSTCSLGSQFWQECRTSKSLFADYEVLDGKLVPLDTFQMTGKT